jgi:hypothetical protein
MKVKTTAHVYHTKYSWEKEARYQIYSSKIDDTEDITYVCEQEFEVEVPDNYNPTAQQLTALQKEKEKAQEEFSKKVASINERISKLQAIEFTA